ncbi:MAG: sugar phosphate isomerase/epimerase family protein [Lachnospiraceae bacterium]
MNRSISNIAWDASDDTKMYEILRDLKYNGLEIAPTRIFPNNPYELLEEAEEFASILWKEYGIKIPSMQSIWFGKSERIFKNKEEYKILLDYTKKAIIFAKSIQCKNLVFGCPRNRNIEVGETSERAISFFKELGEFALENNTCIGIEPNPPIYNTNYINTTKEAFELVEQVGSKGIKVNIDLGTIIQNEESIDYLKDKVSMISHVHISEPNLEKIKKRELHNQLFEILLKGGYERFISIEMKKQEKLEDVMEVLKYINIVEKTEREKWSNL